jgi:nucleoside-diphosphate-sugar epimerase
LLLADAGQSALTPIVLRCAAVYGHGILMVDAAEWLARRRLLCVWKEPTLYQLISSVDFARACEAAIDAPQARGIYHAGDERPITLQEFLDTACKVWGCPRPRRLPFGMIYLGAAACEAFAFVARTTSPLTRDFVRLGRVPHWGDTRRFRQELLPELVYPTLESGLGLLRA